MTQLSEEQKQHEDPRHIYHTVFNPSGCDKFYCLKRFDPDRVSLLDSDSQAAARPVGWISCGLRHGHDRIVDIVFENADCAKAFIDGVEPVIGPIVAATAIRDKCVEKVKAIRKSSLWNANGYDTALSNLVAELSSLTLDEVKPEEM